MVGPECTPQTLKEKKPRLSNPTILLFNHRQSYNDDSIWEASFFHRINTDHYILKRDDLFG